MDRQQFGELVAQRLSGMNLDSLKIINEGEDSLTVEVTSSDFLDKSILTRINLVYEMIEEFINAVNFHISIVPLTPEEIESDNSKASKERRFDFFDQEGRVATQLC